MSLRAAAAALSLAIIWGCAPATEEVAPDEDVDRSESDVSAYGKSWVSVRRDFRKCIAPLCGGWWVRDVNETDDEQYVSELDLSSWPAASEFANLVHASEDELVLHGKLGKKEKTYGTRPFVVFDVYRGLPGVTRIEGDAFYRVEPRDPQIQCVTAPCNNLVAKKLNSSSKKVATSVAVELATMSQVNPEWLVDRIMNHDALVAALILKGATFPGGKEIVVDASQVYLKVPLGGSTCKPGAPPVCAEGEVATSYPIAAGCIFFDACVPEPTDCGKAPGCDDRYLGVSYIGGDGCPSTVCYPDFEPATDSD